MYICHSLENRHEIVLKTMYFAGKTAIWLSERYKVFGSVAMYQQGLQCISECLYHFYVISTRSFV